ncbi:uncharacterized protein LOC110459524 [Mizuhopecten yessoensis]|uniref:uncharacterized protein LOC110459524 n=1 Tax=Mizuhopecten yessoensis TaxID=6573 RepID=UPI000B45C27F|nr:uncharacterized protein LOC110459524 [Mizuhopecten yessoensis]
MQCVNVPMDSPNVSGRVTRKIYNLSHRFTVAHENNLDRNSKSRPAAGVYSDAEFAARNWMVELVVGSCVYLHEDQLHTAKNKGVSNDGRKIARFLLNVFFRKETLAKSSITSSEMAKYDPLDFTTTEAIIAFSTLHSQTKRSDILRAMRSTLTSYRNKQNSAHKRQNHV